MPRRAFAIVAAQAVPAGLALSGAALLATPDASATTYLLKPDGTGTVPDLQTALAMAVDGDTILLEDGVYSGAANRDLSFQGKAITVGSQSGNPDACVIDCDPSIEPDVCGVQSAGFSFTNGEGPGSVLEGIGIRNTRVSGAVCCDCTMHPYGAVLTGGSSPTIRNVAIRSCEFALIISGGAPLITGCVLEANSHTGSAGGAVLMGETSATIEHCRISGNSVTAGQASWLVIGGGAISSRQGDPLIRHCTITGNSTNNSGGAIFIDQGTIESCTIAGNAAAKYGGGIHVDLAGSPLGSGVTITNTIVWDNCVQGSPDDIYVRSGALSLECSSTGPNGISGPGTVTWQGPPITAAPLFCEALPCAKSTAGVFTLDDDSELLNFPGCGLIGAEPQGCTLGLVPATWGRIQSIYR